MATGWVFRIVPSVKCGVEGDLTTLSTSMLKAPNAVSISREIASEVTTITTNT